MSFLLRIPPAQPLENTDNYGPKRGKHVYDFFVGFRLKTGAYTTSFGPNKGRSLYVWIIGHNSLYVAWNLIFFSSPPHEKDWLIGIDMIWKLLNRFFPNPQLALLRCARASNPPIKISISVLKCRLWRGEFFNIWGVETVKWSVLTAFQCMRKRNEQRKEKYFWHFNTFSICFSQNPPPESTDMTTV